MTSERKINKIRILLEGNGPNENGWWGMYCPYHGDSKRSAGLNVDEERFTCHACGEHKTLDELIADKDEWVIRVPGYAKADDGTSTQEISQATVDGWHKALMSNEAVRNDLMSRRGLSIKTIQRHELGWDTKQQAYTIPIRDFMGKLLNVRFYQLDPPDKRRKIWSTAGHGSPVLWPPEQLDYPAIVICEGEMDAMLTIQNGVPAITRTGAAEVWRSDWDKHFLGKTVVICHDMDATGKRANAKLRAKLRNVALRTIVVKLPFKMRINHGKDLTDYWLAGHTREDFIQLVASSEETRRESKGGKQEGAEEELFDVGVIDTFDPKLVNRPLQMKVTVLGKRQSPYTLPENVAATCNMEAGTKCTKCPMGPDKHAGQMDYTIGADDPIILEMIGTTREKLHGMIRRAMGVPKCIFWKMDEAGPTSYRTVEELYVRPSVEDNALLDTMTHREIISTVTHNVAANQTLVVTGKVVPQPKNQRNEFLTWKVEVPSSTLDSFDEPPEIVEQMVEFRTQDPMSKLYEIADDIAVHHTHILGRPEMHMFMDLVYHSVLHHGLQGTQDTKGWLDGLIFGDTRTGKSAAAEALRHLYGQGAQVSCEAATIAGVMGGLDRVGNKNQDNWTIKWGVVPLMHRRIAILDEASGLTPPQISQMSSMRSSGKAELTKIVTHVTWAQTRLLWLANPRDGKPMSSSVNALELLKELIGNSEDIARFDMAMCVFTEEVPAKKINRYRTNGKKGTYTQEAYRAMLRWAWTRTEADVHWDQAALKMLPTVANSMSDNYVPDPPLVQGANVRMKLARIAVAMAARTYSTVDGTRLDIKPMHVEAAAEFLNLIYGNPGFGYLDASRRKIQGMKQTMENMDRINALIAKYPMVSTLIRANSEVSFLALRPLLSGEDAVRDFMRELFDLNAATLTERGMTIEPLVLKQMRGETYVG